MAFHAQLGAVARCTRNAAITPPIRLHMALKVVEADITQHTHRDAKRHRL